MDVVDLTSLSSTMVYAEVNNMMTNPEKYIGKTIKMSGTCYNEFIFGIGTYHYVIIEDATACCAQGMEFIWNGEHINTVDYPKEQAKIEVTGIFDSYEKFDGIRYYILADDISILNE